MNFLMKITDLSILCKWGNKSAVYQKLIWPTVYVCICIYILYIYIYILSVSKLIISTVHRDVDEDD